MKIIHITTGDPNGIGLEVSLKALREIGPVKNIGFVLWRSAEVNEEIFQLVNKKFQVFTGITSPDQKPFSQKKIRQDNVLWDLACPSTPALWVVQAGKLCLQNKKHSALVTGPISKTQIKKEKFLKAKGHTDLLKELTGAEHVFMAFLGEFFNVALLTDHVPLKKIKWSEEGLNKAISYCLKLKNTFADKHFLSAQHSLKKFSTSSKNLERALFKNSSKKLAVLGLNPHAGEEGLLGKEELLLKAQLQKWKNKVDGPLVPDIAFNKENWKKYFMYLCLYHDQALIPFKMVHKRNSFQVNLGLDFLRTSVSHGTAKDIFGQNKANANSMKQALLWAIKSLN